MRLTLHAVKRDGTIVPPRTKKNSAQIARNKKGLAFITPSPEFLEWQRAILSTLRGEGIIEKTGDGEFRSLVGVIDAPVNCRALIYRERNVGDAVGYYQAIGDVLQKAGLVTNDRFIVQWDGTRMLKDAKRPRVEVWLEPLTTAGEGQVVLALKPIGLTAEGGVVLNG